jgi:hypothetical protein
LFGAKERVLTVRKEELGNKKRKGLIGLLGCLMCE